MAFLKWLGALVVNWLLTNLASVVAKDVADAKARAAEEAAAAAEAKALEDAKTEAEADEAAQGSLDNL